jgi:periplasmic copper chaperone A
MSQSSSFRRRTYARLGTGIGAAVIAVLAMPGLAQAHVTVQPGSAEGGSFSVIAFRVPNEREETRTTQLQVILPEDQPIGSVQTTPIPGWKITTKTRHLDKPIEMFGEQLDTVVSQVSWTATGGGIRPGQFQDFDLSLGQLPESGELVFNAVQIYSNGDRVNWNQISADPSVEPEHPAPILTITPPSAKQDSTASGGQASDNKEVTPATQGDNASGAILSSVLSVVAMLLSVVAVLLAWRWRRPTPEPEVADSSSRQDINA